MEISEKDKNIFLKLFEELAKKTGLFVSDDEKPNNEIIYLENNINMDDNQYNTDYYEINKNKILDLFIKNIKNKPVDYINENFASEGHWLERKMNIKHNSYNKPDLLGFEMKKYSNKITFGDFSASEYLFSKNNKYIIKFNKFNKINNIDVKRLDFIRYFGTPNPNKNNRYSWSGRCFPTYGIWNDCGQILIFDNNKNLCIFYSYSKDKRNLKNTGLEYLKKDNLLIAIWKYDKLKKHIENKFNQNGFFICHKNKKTKMYDKISFGIPFNIDLFIIGIKQRRIILDSGMYETNSRNYSQFRSSFKDFWKLLIVEEY